MCNVTELLCSISLAGHVMSRTLHLVITLLGLLGLRECTAQSCVTIDSEFLAYEY